MSTVLVHVSSAGDISCVTDSAETLVLVLDERDAMVRQTSAASLVCERYLASSIAEGLPRVDADMVATAMHSLAVGVASATAEPGLLQVHRTQLRNLAKALSSRQSPSAVEGPDVS